MVSRTDLVFYRMTDIPVRWCLPAYVRIDQAAKALGFRFLCRGSRDLAEHSILFDVGEEQIQFHGYLCARAQIRSEMYEWFPADLEIQEIANAIYDLQRRNAYNVWADVRSLWPDIGVRITASVGRGHPFDDSEQAEAVLSRFVDWIFKQIKTQYDKLSKDEKQAEWGRTAEVAEKREEARYMDWRNQMELQDERAHKERGR